MTQRNLLVVVLYFGLISLVASSNVFASDIKTDSKIIEITIYPGAALVTRQAQFDVPAGDHTVLFENYSN